MYRNIQSIRRSIVSIVSGIGVALPIVFRFENIIEALYSGTMNIYLKNFVFSKEFLISFSYILLLTIIGSGITMYAAMVSLVRGLKLKRG